MENETVENDTQTEEELIDVEETPTEPGEVEEVEESPELKSALIQKEKFKEKLAKKEAELNALQKAQTPATGEIPDKSLDVEDYIDISTSLDGLDSREKAYLAEQHKLSGKSLKEIREGEDFGYWQSAYQAAQAKEAALKPNATQEREDAPVTLTEALKGKSIAEKEELLTQANLYKENKPGAHRVDIGQKLSQ